MSQLDSRQHVLIQSTLPVKGATRKQTNEVSNPLFQSTLPVKGATAHLKSNISKYEHAHCSIDRLQRFCLNGVAFNTLLCYQAAIELIT